MLTQILKWLDDHKVVYKETAEAYIMPTICHNLYGGSEKLYLYKNKDETPLFHCYTECAETFNIYTLIIKYHALRDKTYSFRDAYKELWGYEVQYKPKTPIAVNFSISAIQHPMEVVLPEYESIAENIVFSSTQSPWLFEGISEDILEYYGIRYCPYTQRLLIPHRDWQDRLIGYRVRHFEEKQIEFGKYRPLQHNGIIYRHPLSYNFFGWSENWEIHTTQEVYIYESEKSVLLHNDLVGYNAVAICGSSISTWHLRMLALSKVKNVYLCPDRDYTTLTECYELVAKMKEKTKLLQQFANVYIIIDEQCNILGHKNSPIDQTKNDFNKLRRLLLNNI